ncbi:DUF885 domain-containing protein [uncultured Amnibacterium sp.]|uniref:DUF885 domain-containing protein n=1 Tax=uncultured Amnibacterium sp. TaxID=1631851 RepID=UPI0035C972FA
MTAERRPTELDAVAERWVDTSVALAPELAVWLGRSGFEGRYGDLSPDGDAARAAAARQALQAVRAAAPTDAVDQVTKLDLTRELELHVERHEAGESLGNVAVIESPVQNVRDIFDLEPTDTEQQWAVVAARMAAVPAAMAGYLQTLRLGIERGRVPAIRQVSLAADEADEAAADGGYFDALAGRGADAPVVPQSLAHELQRASGQARAAYSATAAFLREQLAPVARTHDAVGRERYTLASRGFLGATVDLDETYEWGLEELARVTEEQRVVAATIVPGGGVDEAIAALDADPARTLGSTDELRDWMQSLSDAAVTALAGTHFDIPDQVRRLECRIAPTTSGVIYYTPPSDDFARPGRMWWSVPAGVSRFGTWRETTTVYHEGVPGHHLQNGVAIANRAQLNSWRRSTFVSGHGEGWALYAERLMADLGFLDDPGDRLGMLDGQRMRAARVVIDIGVHLRKPHPDGGTWNAERALATMREHVHMDDAFLRFEVNRYLGWPGQAPSYKVGQRIWEQLRDEVRAREGAAWDARAFHGHALAIGGVGLETLRTALLAG